MQFAWTIPALEDKLVQAATTEVLSALYETDFQGFSYGFRPGRGALDGALGPALRLLKAQRPFGVVKRLLDSPTPKALWMVAQGAPAAGTRHPGSEPRASAQS